MTIARPTACQNACDARLPKRIRCSRGCYPPSYRKSCPSSARRRRVLPRSASQNETPSAARARGRRSEQASTGPRDQSTKGRRADAGAFEQQGREGKIKWQPTFAEPTAGTPVPPLPTPYPSSRFQHLPHFRVFRVFRGHPTFSWVSCLSWFQPPPPNLLTTDHSDFTDQAARPAPRLRSKV